MERIEKMNTTKIFGEWVVELKKLNKAIAYLNEKYETIQEVENKEALLTALKCVEQRHDLIIETLTTINVPDML